MSAFLCLRRGVSPEIYGDERRLVFSLPTQRCFFGNTKIKTLGKLFSAYAEVFPGLSTPFRGILPFLCLRRGVSHESLLFLFQYWLFSAYAEVFPTAAYQNGKARTFLCLRRGVSVRQTAFHALGSFSLPTQRCFRLW